MGRVAAVGTLVVVLAGSATAAGEARFAPRLRAELVHSLASGPSLILDVSAKGCVHNPAGAMGAALSASRGAVRKLTLRFFVHERRGTRITVCLPRQNALAGRAAVRLVRGLGSPPDGTSVWRGLFTPVGKGGGAAAYPTTTERRGTVVGPSFLTVQGPAAARRGRSRRLRRLLSFGKGQGRREIRISTADDVLARARTSRSGSYAVRVPAPKRVGTLALQARLPSRLVQCGGRTVDAPRGCTSSTLAGVTSNVLAVRLR